MPMENNSPRNLRNSLVGVVGKNPFGSFLMDSEWQQRAEEELNETPEIYKRELEALRLMVKNDPNLSVPDNDQFLLRFLRARKFESKKAFLMLQRYFLMRLKCPELFGCSLPSECSVMFELQAQNMLQQRDQLGRRVYVIRVGVASAPILFLDKPQVISACLILSSNQPICYCWSSLARTRKINNSPELAAAVRDCIITDNFDSSKVTIDDVFRANVLALEQIVREAETQIAGIVVILDMAGLSLQHAKFFTPYYAKRMVELVQETFPLRFKGFHIVNEPFYFDAVVAVLKPFLKEKIRKRIVLHGSDLTSLQAFVSSDILPGEYGGTAGNFDNRPWYMQLLAEENYFKDLHKYGYKIEGDVAEEV